MTGSIISSTAIDLSRLPKPEVVREIDYETILTEMLADLRARFPDFSALVESDPAYKVLEVAAYREMVNRQKGNDAALAVMIAYAAGADLDNLAALFGVQRLTIVEADDEKGIGQQLESDDNLRERVLLAPDS
ncbi:hypothetical protein [Novosphingopyxis sp. YJ-S2-01]|uniref:hypothetical protein n=1 Tax=Novosphingopyxis sp. YJ-S2-01 TaxID=2794021 RepID=UPI001E623D7B|nr:hypothetical protein [Novosphingopyxis sp. YJ-S2-01]